MIKNLSVFFPAYNEEKNIENTVEKAKAVLENLKIDWEILVINDGSTDKTGEISEKLSAEDKRIRTISHKVNSGYGEALKSGFYNAKFDWIVFTDSDGQFDFSEIDKFLEKTEEADYIIGYRMKRSDPFYRKVTGKAWALSVFLLFGIWVKDIDGGFRMIKKSVIEKIPPLESTRGAMINAELLIKVKKMGYKIAQVGVHHYPRAGGVATGVKFNVVLRSYLELFKLWIKLK